MRTITEVRGELLSWGQYWRRQKYGKGFSTRSSVSRLGEAAPSANSFRDGHSDNIKVPVDIELLSNSIDKLNTSTKAIITSYYLKGDRTHCIVINGVEFKGAHYKRLLAKAESSLL